MSTWMTATFGSLSVRHFRVLWSGSLLAFVAFFMSTIVQGIVAYDLTGKNGSVGVVVFAQGLSQIVLGPFGGALADRMSKRLVILVCQAIITVTFFVTSALIGLDLINVPLLFASSFLIGAAFSFLGPARQAFVGEILEPNRRGNAIALTQVALNGSRILGPLLAGIFLSIDWLDAGGAYFLMGALYVFAMITTAMLPRTVPNAAASKSVLGDIRLGLQYVYHHRQLRLLVSSFVLVIMLGFPYVAVLPGLVKGELDRGDGSLTILYLANATGGLLASLVVASLADSPRATAIYTTSCVTFGAALGLIAVMPGFWAIATMMFVVGVSGGAFQTLNGAVVLKYAEPAYYGRVMSLTFLAFAMFALVALPLGFLADATGERSTLAIMGAAVVLVVIVLNLLGRRTAPVLASATSAAGGQ